MIQTKLCNSCDPPTEWPLNEKYFYKNKLSPDGLADKCRKCQKKNNLQRYYNKNKNLNKIYDVNGKSKVPTLPKVKIKTRTIQQWKKDLYLICVIRCRYCNEVLEIRNKYHVLNCKCGHNLLTCSTINFLWSKLLYLNDKVKDYSISTFDPYR